MSVWQETKLGNLGKVITGKTPSKDSPEDWGSEVLFITPSDYKNYGKYANSSIRMLSSVGAKRQASRILPKGSVLVTCIGSDMGKTAINAEPCVTNQQINAIIPNNDTAYLDFIYYLTKDLYEKLSSLGSDGTAVPILNKSDFENIDVFIPKLEEQKAIASVLSSLDDKIDLLHRQNTTLERMAETLFRHWFIEEAQDDWEEGCLGDVSENIRKSIQAKDIQATTKYIGLEHIDRRSIALKHFGVGEDVSSNKYAFEKNDILFGKLRPYFHKVCFSSFSGICSTDILVIRPKNPIYFAFCLFAFFQNDVVEFANLGSGGTRMPRTDWETLKQYPISLPDKNTILKFNDVVFPSISKISENLTQIQTLEKLRDNLLPKLMSGDVRIQDD